MFTIYLQYVEGRRRDVVVETYETVGGTTYHWHYLYDPFGRRVERKAVHTSGGGDVVDFWTRTYFDGVQPIEETVVTGGSPPDEIRAKFVRVYGPYLVDQLLWASGDLWGAGPSFVYEGYFQGDFLGTVQCIVSDIANAISIEGGDLETYRYTEYGEVQFCAGDGTYYSPNQSQGEQDSY